ALCTNNSECAATDSICCPNLDGTATCQDSCAGGAGGLCRPDAQDCADDESCCDIFGLGNICLEECPI
ncbi:MAG: hypothetical protein AAGI01_18490, partial [Myxococcota bacterium]